MNDQNALGITHFLANSDAMARVILCFMLAGSIWSWFLIAKKSIYIAKQRRARVQALVFFQSNATPEGIQRHINNADALVVHSSPFWMLMQCGLQAFKDASGTQGESGLSTDDILTRGLRRGIDGYKMHADSGQTFLATLASNAPFVGLLGTVWGIYHALIAIGASGQGSLDKVAGPVGESLIMTAIGLAVAIPAAIAYNIFARHNKQTVAQLGVFASDLRQMFQYNLLDIKTKTQIQQNNITKENT